jgi:hypothetical protein
MKLPMERITGLAISRIALLDASIQESYSESIDRSKKQTYRSFRHDFGALSA